MVKFQSLKPLIFFHLLVNVLIVFFITGASYFHIPLEGFKDTAVYMMHLVALQITVAGFVYVLSLIPWVFRIVFPLLFVIYACFSFWAYTQDVSITPSLLQAIFETKTDIAVDLITIPYVLFILAVVAVLFFLLKYYNRLEPKKNLKLWIVPAILCIGLFFFLEDKRRGSLKNRLPYNLVYGINAYFEMPKLQLNHEVEYSNTTTDSLKVILVLGETVRADHLGLNGYARNTTPKLSARENLISFPKLYTAYTYTGASVPQLLTDRNLSDMERPLTTLFTVANTAGYKTSWIGNQTLEKSYSPVVETNQQVMLVDEYKSEFSFAKELDGVMIAPADSLLKTTSKQLITLHMIGSHWWYENRYTEEFRKFSPVIDSKYVPSLEPEELINSYDNTIVYLDWFLDELISVLEEDPAPTLLIYVADHGEHLGENGKWLHAQAGEEAKNPAYLIWYSEAYGNQFPDLIKGLKDSSNKSLTTDTFFYTALNLLDIDFKL